MARLDLNLAPINAQRQSLQTLQIQLRNLDQQFTSQQAAYTAAVRAGQSANATEPLRVQMEATRSQRGQLLAKRRDLELEIDRVADGLLRARDPALMTEALDGTVPIALLPMRLETRYFPAQRPNEQIMPDRLRIRIYPDDLNIVQHTAVPTEAELQAAQAYWLARFVPDNDEAERIARDLAQSQGRNRCAWLLRLLTPLNSEHIDQPDAEPQFPDTPTIAANAKQTRALLLPDRWCAIGYASGRREVFRVWGERIPDELVLTPDWLNLDNNKREALFDGERAWLADFDAAVKKGMAIEVTQQAINAHLLRQHAPQGFHLGSETLERLIVVGLEWTKDAAQSADELAELLSAQRDSNGLGFIPLGTPTNNTESAAAGYSQTEEREAPLTPSANAQLPPEKDALQLLTHALGLPETKLTANGIQNAHLSEQRTALHMLNALWRGTFGQYLFEQWNPFNAEEKDRHLKTPTLYALRRYAISYLRPAGALPLLRVGKQPYGILPVVGKSYVSINDKLESGIGKVLTVLRPLWESAAQQKVPLLKDGNIDKAKAILQTNAWAQEAFYRDAKPLYFSATSIPQPGTKRHLINTILDAVGVSASLQQDKNFAFNWTRIASWDFYPDPPNKHTPLTGVPWVLADKQDATKEATATLSFEELLAPANYLSQLANNITNEALLKSYQAGPTLLQALLSYSVQLELHDSVTNFVYSGTATEKIASVVMPSLSYVEARQEDGSRFAVNNPLELASVVIPQLTGRATLGEFVAQNIALQAISLPASNITSATTMLYDSLLSVKPQLRDVTAVKLSLDYLSGCSVGELNVSFRTTLDAFSYRLDAWYSARANQRLALLRTQHPTGVYVGGFAWVENLRADHRPDSDGYLLTPSLNQAATAALLRSGFMANHEQGAFNIELNSVRTRQGLDILQGLTRDQPLAALYGYRIERGLRDGLLGKLIWPLRLAYPWRAKGDEPSDEPQEAIGARDVVDGVALLAAWEVDGGNAVRTRLSQLITARGFTNTDPTNNEWTQVVGLMQQALDLADSVSDLLMAEGVYQIAQGNFERAGAATAIIDKQSLPIEPQVNLTPRGGASYTQRMALLCPAPQGNWPEDRRSRTEPALNAWLAQMLGEPTRYQFSAHAIRGVDADNKLNIDPVPVTVGLSELGLSPLSAVLTATSIYLTEAAGAADTGFRGRLVEILSQKIDDLASVTGLNIQQEGVASSLGLGHFEAIATTLRALLDKTRPLTRKDLVVPDDALEAGQNEGEYPGVDAAELRLRADTLIADFGALTANILASANAEALLANLVELQDFIPPTAWPQQLQLLSNPMHSDADFALAVAALAERFTALNERLTAPIQTDLDADGIAKAPNHAQLSQKAVEQIKLLLGKDFPVLPRFSLGAYSSQFNVSLDTQSELTLGNPWQVSGWLSKVARVHEGLDRFAGALSAHEALVDFSNEQDFKVVQYANTDRSNPPNQKQIWAALPEAWREEEGAAFDPASVPEELREFLAQHPGTPFKNINRVVPKLALALHTPGGLEPLADDSTLAGLVCDEWAETIPDRFQTAGLSFHYDAPGARPPQSILLALPPTLGQENWQFEQVLDVLHEAWDLARLRAVRPQDLEGGIGALLPGNFLPHTYTDVLPSVTLQKLASLALSKFKTLIVPLGKG
jgi:hypothetical protein